ncbi:MAG: HlyD family efflux transporter periplasmic adaptor subunit [Thiohalocapsa sp.]|jgi:HlyD family secretion protein|uniref:HlyD family secretion protein n=1 Tax=Thiohalocapsa sp. TaxID=2497641 RepID=UPI0025F318BB|nr:HlyD family efflux transporter periplasmic adaptor subunit [Thiohalocapsa sp.]MCG6939739.1 HlyD family efflux transporter periplasmic adaptor subunit [Thiohalocapsa sp.]
MRLPSLLLVTTLLWGCAEEGPNVALGTLERDRIALTATAAEVLVDLPVAQGTLVKRGTVLARLDDREQRAVVERSKAEVTQASANLQKLRNGPRPQEIAGARAQVAGAKADLREAEITYKRNTELLVRKAVSQADVDQSLARRDAASARLDEARETLDQLLAGTRKEELDQAEAQLAAAEAELAYQQALLADLTIVATRDGVLDNLPWNLGERVTVGSPVVILLAGDEPYARVYVPEPHRVQIKEGDVLKVHVDGLEGMLDGKVRWISAEPAFTPFYALNEADRSRFMYLAEVLLPASAASLPNGVPAQVEMP